jgi:hypothetical protein
MFTIEICLTLKSQGSEIIENITMEIKTRTPLNEMPEEGTKKMAFSLEHRGIYTRTIDMHLITSLPCFMYDFLTEGKRITSILFSCFINEARNAQLSLALPTSTSSAGQIIESSKSRRQTPADLSRGPPRTRRRGPSARGGGLQSSVGVMSG